MNKWLVIGTSIVVSIFIAANAVLLFSNKSEITKSYYVNEYDRVYENTFTKELEKESVIVPVNESTVTIDVDAVNDILVTEGDTVQQGAELVQLKTVSADDQRMLWQTEQEAYMQEQSQLNQIIGNLESERAGADSTSSSNGSTTGSTDDETIDVNVQVDVNISQEGNFAQAIAEAEQKLAEVDRKLQIVSAQLNQESGELTLLSPIEGSVAAIEERNGKYFIEIYGTEKSVITFANEVEWHQIKEGLHVKNYSSHQEGVVEGSILTKAEVPANASKWLTAYEQFGNKTEEPVYEMRISLEEQRIALPFGANINSVIITDEAENAVRVKTKWLLNRSKELAEVYTLTNEGRIMRTPVTVPFDVNQNAILSEGLQSESVVLNAEPKNVDAPAFLPFPLDLPSWSSIKAVSWKDYMKYLTYK